MNRFDILLKKPAPPPLPVPLKPPIDYYMGIDIGFRTETAIVITHKEAGKIFIDYAKSQMTPTYRDIMDWLAKLRKIYSIRLGLSDGYYGDIANRLGIHSVNVSRAINAELTFNFESNRSIIVMDDIGYRFSFDALIKSVWLTTKNDPNVTLVTDRAFSYVV
jgi:hypothetical protein